MKKLLFFFFFISVFSFSQQEKRLALVIGNSNYDKGELKNPISDANLIAQTLGSLDFDVILKENIETRSQFIRAIREFGNQRPDYDVAFVYYAGHGIQVDDENFLLPTKEEFTSEEDVLDFAVSVQNIMRYLKAQTNEVNILILDACRDNPFESKWNATRSLKGKGLAKIPPPTGSLIAFSTDSGQTAPDGDGENSVYTISLAKNMLLEDTSIDQVFRNVRAEVLAETNGMQRPVEATQLTGDGFYMKPKTSKKLINDFDNALLNGDYELGLNLSFQLINNFPKLSSSYVKAGHMRLITKEYDKSIEYYKKALNIDSTNYNALTTTLFPKNSELISLGLIESLQRYYESSAFNNNMYADDADKLVQLLMNKPDFNDLYVGSVLLNSINVFDIGKVQTSINLLEMIIEDYDNDVVYGPFSSFEEFYKSISIYDKTVVETFSVKAILYNQISSLYDELVDFKKSKGLPYEIEQNESLKYINNSIYYEKERDMKSPNLSYLYNLKSTILRKQGNLKEAEKFSFKAIEYNRNKSNAHNFHFLSKIYFELNDKKNAVKYVNLSLEEDKKYNVSNITLANRYFIIAMLHFIYEDYLRAFSYVETGWNLDKEYSNNRPTFQFFRALTLIKLNDKSLICDSDFNLLIQKLGDDEYYIPSASIISNSYYGEEGFWLNEINNFDFQNICPEFK